MWTQLTIGIPTYEDFEGVWATLQALSMYHPKVAYLVIDNSPKLCDRTKRITESVGGTYLHRPDLTGTCAPKNALFSLAKTKWVLCIDSHILLELGAIQSLLSYIEKNPESNDLIQGPLVFDTGETVATHWNQHLPPILIGQWACYLCWQQDEPFEIPMQGMGLFAMRRKAWPGFNPLFRGFGAEEGYIHEKVRRAGGKCLCLPSLLWRHRFRDGVPAPYSVKNEDKIRNLLIGHKELEIDATDMIKQEFPLPPNRFEEILTEIGELEVRVLP